MMPLVCNNIIYGWCNPCIMLLQTNGGNDVILIDFVLNSYSWVIPDDRPQQNKIN